MSDVLLHTLTPVTTPIRRQRYSTLVRVELRKMVDTRRPALVTRPLAASHPISAIFGRMSAT